MKQFGTIFSFELKYYFKNKVFVGVTVFLVLAIALVMFFPRVQAALQSSDAPTPEEAGPAADGTGTGGEADARPLLLLKTPEGEDAEFLREAFTGGFADYRVQATDAGADEIKEKILSGEAECAFVLDSATSYTYYVGNLTIYDSNPQAAGELLRYAYQTRAMLAAGMTAEAAADAMSVEIDSRLENLGKDQAENYWYTYIMIFALYMVILLYGQMVATNVATEKSSRAMEVLITSARPVSMMFGKVLASCLAGLLQLAAVFGSAILCYTLNESYWGGNFIVSSIFDMPPALLAYMLIFFVLGFLIYAFMFGAVGSTASKLEDINTSVMPITLLFIVGFMVVMFSFASGDVDNTLMRVCSYVPFTSSMAMFTRIAMSTVPWYEIAISIAILIGSVVGVGVLSAKIYRVGVLLYGTTPKLGAVWKQATGKNS